MRKFVNGRLALTFFVVAILVLLQVLPKMTHGHVLNCSVLDPTNVEPYFYTYYGFPSDVLVTYTEGDPSCSGNLTTNISSFSMEGLLVNILFVVVVGALPYLIFSLLDRFRRNNTD